MNAGIEFSGTSNTYVIKRKQDLTELFYMLKENPELEIYHSRTDNWIRVNGIIYNAITRKDIEKIRSGISANVDIKDILPKFKD